MCAPFIEPIELFSIAGRSRCYRIMRTGRLRMRWCKFLLAERAGSVCLQSRAIGRKDSPVAGVGSWALLSASASLGNLRHKLVLALRLPLRRWASAHRPAWHICL